MALQRILRKPSFQAFVVILWSPKQYICVVKIFNSICENTFSLKICDGQILSSSSKKRERSFQIKHEEERKPVRSWGWGMGGGPAAPHCSLPNWRSRLFPLWAKKAVADSTSSFQPQQKPVGREFAFFLSVSYGLQITNYSPFLSPNNQLVPESESPAQFSLSLKMQGRFSPAKAVQLLISGARLSKQSNTFVELWELSFTVW